MFTPTTIPPVPAVPRVTCSAGGALLDGYEVANTIGVWRDDGATTKDVLLLLVSAIIGYTGEVRGGS
jgi:hypothetical protein